MSFPKLRRIQAPAALPVELPEVKAHLRVFHADEDVLITSYIGAVVTELDGKDGELFYCLAPQRWEQAVTLGACATSLPLGPVNTETVEVAYVDDDGSRVALPSTAFEVVEAQGVDDTYVTWLDGVPSGRKAFISYTAGAVEIDPAIKAAIFLLVEDLYNGRDAPPARERTIASLLKSFKRDIVVE